MSLTGLLSMVSGEIGAVQWLRPHRQIPILLNKLNFFLTALIRQPILAKIAKMDSYGSRGWLITLLSEENMPLDVHYGQKTEVYG